MGAVAAGEWCEKVVAASASRYQQLCRSRFFVAHAPSPAFILRLAASFPKDREIGNQVPNIFVSQQRLRIHRCAWMAEFDGSIAVFVILGSQAGRMT